MIKELIEAKNGIVALVHINYIPVSYFEQGYFLTENLELLFILRKKNIVKLKS